MRRSVYGESMRRAVREGQENFEGLQRFLRNLPVVSGFLTAIPPVDGGSILDERPPQCAMGANYSHTANEAYGAYAEAVEQLGATKERTDSPKKSRKLMRRHACGPSSPLTVCVKALFSVDYSQMRRYRCARLGGPQQKIRLTQRTKLRQP
jgi:hypothetical protein